jgi:hypothetical protein
MKTAWIWTYLIRPGPEAALAQRQDLAALDDALNASVHGENVSSCAVEALVQSGTDHGRPDRNGHVAPLARGRRSS